MSLTRPIPNDAARALNFIREVPKPAELPSVWKFKCGNGENLRLRWAALRDIGDEVVPATGRCPLGLHPKAVADAPGASWDDLPHGAAVRSFIDWWDEQDDARAAVDAVWSGAQ